MTGPLWLLAFGVLFNHFLPMYFYGAIFQTLPKSLADFSLSRKVYSATDGGIFIPGNKCC